MAKPKTAKPKTTEPGTAAATQTLSEGGEGAKSASKVSFPAGWIIAEGSTRTVYDPDTGEKSEELVAPWTADYLHGGAKLAAAAAEALVEQIKTHPYTTNPPEVVPMKEDTDG